MSCTTSTAFYIADATDAHAARSHHHAASSAWTRPAGRSASRPAFPPTGERSSGTDKTRPARPRRGSRPSPSQPPCPRWRSLRPAHVAARRRVFRTNDTQRACQVPLIHEKGCAPMSRATHRHERAVWQILLLVVFVAACAPPSAAAPSFTGLGFLPGATSSGAPEVSADGSVVGREQPRTGVSLDGRRRNGRTG